MLDIATVADDSDVEGGIDKGLGDEGLLDNRWSCNTPLRSNPISRSKPVSGCSFNSFYLPFY